MQVTIFVTPWAHSLVLGLNRFGKTDKIGMKETSDGKRWWLSQRKDGALRFGSSRQIEPANDRARGSRQERKLRHALPQRYQRPLRDDEAR